MSSIAISRPKSFSLMVSLFTPKFRTLSFNTRPNTNSVVFVYHTDAAVLLFDCGPLVPDELIYNKAPGLMRRRISLLTSPKFR